MKSSRTLAKSALGAVPGGDLLWGWSRELAAACAAREERLWDDVGRAAVLLTADALRAEQAARLVAEAAGLNFIAIQQAALAEMPHPATLACGAPALVWLEPGEWLSDAADCDSTELAGCRQIIHDRLVDWISSFDPDCPLVLVTAASGIDAIATQLGAAGLFDRCFSLPRPALVQLGNDLLDELGRDVCSKSLRSSPAKLGKLVEWHFLQPRARGLAIVYLRRLARRSGRRLEFTDLMHLSVHGHVEAGKSVPASEQERRATAVHEAGHAAAAIIDSKGRDIPDFCSIIPGVNFLGVVAPSVTYAVATESSESYDSFRHAVRTALAGRAAEELVYGPELVSTGARADLGAATAQAERAFAVCGFAPDMSTHDQSASNLAVVLDEPTPSQSAHIEALARRFLEQEYRYVYRLLEAHRDLLDAIADRLLWDPIVDQAELKAIRRELRRR